jgi:hypothetical protein
MDLKGVGISKVSSVYSYVKQASAISQNYYPERLGRLYLINAPWGFSGVWSIVKGWLDPVTVQKIHILGSGYQKELLEQVPAENLPTIFGGTCECSGGCAFSDQGPWTDPQWTRTPKWAKKDEKEATINNEGVNPGTIPDGGAKPAAASAPTAEDVADEIKPAPAPQ